MPTAPETPSQRFSRWFWKVWEKTSVLIFLLFVGLNVVAGNAYGWRAVIRGWGAGFALIGLATLLWYWVGTRRAAASTGWRPVQARILSSRVTVEQSSSDPDWDNIGPITYYYPEVVYEYDVEGATYTSNKILFVAVNYRHAEAEATVARYPAGSRVTAWVDPHNPRLAVLEPGLEGKRGKYAIAAVVGAAFTAVGAALWFLLPVVVPSR